MARAWQERVSVVRGDITRQRVDAIVNAANNTLLGGGGVDGAIHLAAGPGLLEECRSLGRCETGDAKITGAYHLPAEFVIHAVGPVWQGGDAGEDELLASAYTNALRRAVENGVSTIAFPAISTGAYGFPMERAARIAVRAVRDFLTTDDSIDRVVFVCRGDDAYRAFATALENGIRGRL